MSTIKPFIIPKGGSYHSLLIPTIDNVRNNHMLNLYVKQKKHLLLTGPTGTGKTVNIMNELDASYFNEVYTNMVTAFSG